MDALIFIDFGILAFLLLMLWGPGSTDRDHAMAGHGARSRQVEPESLR